MNLALLHLLGLVLSGPYSQAFNLETRHPVIKLGREEAYFGYSVAQHRTLRNTDYGEDVLLVGAPRDDNLQPNTTRSGALWRCPLTSQWKVS